MNTKYIFLAEKEGMITHTRGGKINYLIMQLKKSENPNKDFVSLVNRLKLDSITAQEYTRIYNALK